MAQGRATVFLAVAVARSVNAALCSAARRPRSRRIVSCSRTATSTSASARYDEAVWSRFSSAVRIHLGGEPAAAPIPEGASIVIGDIGGACFAVIRHGGILGHETAKAQRRDGGRPPRWSIAMASASLRGEAVRCSSRVCSIASRQALAYHSPYRGIVHRPHINKNHAGRRISTDMLSGVDFVPRARLTSGRGRGSWRGARPRGGENAR